MAKVEVKMPQMGESITEGTVIAWHKQPGDEVEQDETLLEIGTDKVDTDVPAPESGTLVEILVEEGETVDVGTPIAVIDTEAPAGTVSTGDSASEEAGDATAPGENDANGEPVEEEQESTAKTSAETGGDGVAGTEEVGEDIDADRLREAAGQTADSANGDAVEVIMPKMGESITEGTIISWHKQLGDEVQMDETLLEIGTDKVDTEVPSPAAGILQEILVEEGATVDVGTVIARIGSEALPKKAKQKVAAGEEADTAAEAREKAAEGKREAADEKRPDSDTDAGTRVISRTGSDGRFFSPLVRSIAQKEGLSMEELESIEGTGHGGRLTKKDLMQYLESREAAPEPSRATRPEAPKPARIPEEPLVVAGEGRTEIIEMDRMRQIIANHMIESKRTSAHVTSFAEVDVTGLVRLRNARKGEFMKREGVKLTFTPFFVKAAVDALRDHPILNSSVDGKRIIVKKDIHVGIAVAIDRTGLVVPVIRNARDKSITGLARDAADLADRARRKQLQPDDLQGGTFTVTNIGSLGSVMGTPIILQPQVAILATGAIKKRPVVIEDEELGDIIAIRHMMYLSLSYDHRIIDGAMASSFLHSMIAELESYSEESDI